MPFNEERFQELILQIRTLSNCMVDKNSLVEELHKQLDDLTNSMYDGISNALKNFNKMED